MGDLHWDCRRYQSSVAKPGVVMILELGRSSERDLVAQTSWTWRITKNLIDTVAITMCKIGILPVHDPASTMCDGNGIPFVVCGQNGSPTIEWKMERDSGKRVAVC
jgi:hypothetical protein